MFFLPYDNCSVLRVVEIKRNNLSTEMWFFLFRILLIRMYTYSYTIAVIYLCINYAVYLRN